MSVDRQPTLLDSLRACDLIPAGPLAELAALPESKDPDPRALARVLLQRKLLSRFQINLVAQGKGKDLRVGPYLLLDKLGEGGMGLVYKARHQHMSRVVALKVIRKEKLANADAVHRFYQEVEAAAALHHPNIVLAFDAGQAGSTHYFAMEYIEGIDLARQVKEHGQLPESVACEYVRQAALGLQHAFEKGMVHRDIKPHNLLVTTSGPTAVVKILDMGLARMQGQGDSTGVTQSGQVLGTPDYLAPEQAVNSRAADIRSDLYSLGCTLYFLLAGRPPYSGESLAQVLLKHQLEEAPALDALRPDLSAALPGIVRKMMAKVPDQRFQQPAEVVAALEPFARGEGAAIRMPVLPPLIAKDDTSETWATLGGDDDASISTKLRRKSRDATHVSPGESGLLRKAGRKKDKKEEKKSKVGLYSLIGGGLAVPVVGLILALAFSSGKKDKPRPGADKGKTTNPVTQVKSKPVEQAPPFVGVLEGQILCFGGLAISPDGKLGAFPTPERAIRLYDLQTGKLLHLFPPLPALLSALAFSDDGKRLVAAAGDKLYEYDLKSRKPIGDPNRPGRFLTRDARIAFTIEGKQEPFVAVVRDVATGRERGRFPAADNANLQVSFAANNRRTLMVGFLKTIQIGDLQIPADLRRLTTNNSTIHPTAVCATANDRQVLVGFSDGSVRLIDPSTAREVRAFRGARGGKIWSVALSPDGGQLLTAGDDNLMRLWDVRRGEEVGRFAGHTGAVRDVAFTTDGMRAVSCSHDRTLRVWDLDKPTSRPNPRELVLPPPVVTPPPALPVAGEIRKFPGHVAGVLGVVFTPDGSQALGLDAHGVLQWNVSTGQQIRRFSAPSGGQATMALSGDGLQLFTGGVKLQLWDVKTGKEQKQFIGHEGAVSAVALASNGRLAASGGGEWRIEDKKLVYGDSTVRLWDISTGKELHRFNGHTMKVVNVAFSPDGKWLFSSSYDGTWRIWDVEKREEASGNVQRPGYPPGFAFLPDNRTVLVYPYLNQKLVLWDLKDRKVIREMAGHTSLMTAVLSKDGRLAVSASGSMRGVPGQQPELIDCTVRLWDTSTGKELGKFATPSMNRSVALSPDGTRVLVGDYMGVMRMYDLKKALGKEVPLPSGSPPNEALKTIKLADANSVLAVSPDGKTIAYGGPSVLGFLETPSLKVGSTHPVKANVAHLAFFADSRHLLVGYGDSSMQLWAVAGRKLLQTFTGFTAQLWAIAISPDGRFVAAVADDGNAGPRSGTVRVWDAKTGKQVHRLVGHKKRVIGVRFFPDGKRLLSMEMENNIPDRMAPNMKVWDLATGKEIKSFELPGEPSNPRLSADDKRLLYLSHGSAILYDLEAGRQIQTYRGPDGTGISSVEFCDKERHILGSYWGRKQEGDRFVITQCEIGLWDAESGKQTRRFTGHDKEPMAVACPADSSRAYSVSFDKTIRVWDLGGALPGSTSVVKPTTPPVEKSDRFQGHVGAVNALAVSPNGKYLLTGGADKTVRLWDYETGKELKQFGRFFNSILSVGFSAGSRRAFACDVRTVAISWNAQTGEQSWHHGFQQPGTKGSFPLSDGSGFVRSLGDRIQMHVPQGAGGWSGATSSILIGPLVVTGVSEGRGVAVGDVRGVVGLLDGIRLRPIPPKMLYQHKGPVLALAFSPRGNYLVSAGDDKVIVIRSVKTGKTFLKIPAHASDIYCVAYSPDGKMIVSGSKDRTVRVWSASTGRQIKAFTGLKEPARQVAFDGDGKNVLSCGGELQVWPLNQTADKGAP